MPAARGLLESLHIVTGDYAIWMPLQFAQVALLTHGLIDPKLADAHAIGLVLGRERTVLGTRPSALNSRSAMCLRRIIAVLGRPDTDP